MPQDPDLHDFFVSYARRDNRDGWISDFVNELRAEHRKFSGGRELVPFFDLDDIHSLDDWEQRLRGGLSKSRLFLAFLSPAYFASEWCRREWRTWIDVEIAKHILSAGVAPIHVVEVPGFVTGAGLMTQKMLSEQDVAKKVAELCGLPPPHDAFLEAAHPVLRQVRRRQITSDFVKPFLNEGKNALRRADLREVLARLARDLDDRAQDVRRAAESANTVPPYNKKFSGRLDELLDLRNRLKDDRAGVISGIHGLGGIGKTELAFTYAHAFASAYPGGRFLIGCAGKSSLRDALIGQGDFTNFFGDSISEDERKNPEAHFAALVTCLRNRLDQNGHILLVLDNVTDLALLRTSQTDMLTVLGPQLHLLATTRLLPPGEENQGKLGESTPRWRTLGELSPSDALDLLEKHRPFANEAEREAARTIVRRLGGFALAVELVGAFLLVHPSATYTGLADGLGLEDLDVMAGDQGVQLQQRYNERRLHAVLGPTLASLSPTERRTLDYAALMPPDHVPLPWLKELILRDSITTRRWLGLLSWLPSVGGLIKGRYPNLESAGRFGDPWDDLWRRLTHLALLSRGDVETAEPRILRCHRLVQGLVRSHWSSNNAAARKRRVNALLRRRNDVVEHTTHSQDARWDLEALDAVAQLWADTQHKKAVFLLNYVGRHWVEWGKWSRAETLLRRALAIHEQSLGDHHPWLATHLLNLGVLLLDTNQIGEAEPLIRRALDINEEAFKRRRPDIVSYLFNRALLFLAKNRTAKLAPTIGRALALSDQWDQRRGDIARNLIVLARFLTITNRVADAESLLRRALAIDEQFFGPQHPKVADHLRSLAQLLTPTNRVAEAEPLIRRALAIDELFFGPRHPTIAADLKFLARVLVATNRLAEAEPMMRRALTITQHYLGDDHPSVASCLNDLAMLLEATDRRDEAEPLMRQALSIMKLSYGEEHPIIAAGLNNLAALLKNTNRAPDAEPLSRRSLEILLIFARKTGRLHPDSNAALTNYAAILRTTGFSEPEITERLNCLLAKYSSSGNEER